MKTLVISNDTIKKIMIVIFYIVLKYLPSFDIKNRIKS